MQLQTPLIERAYALARSGSCQDVNEVRRRLKAEGYFQVSDHLEGRTLLHELKRLCEAKFVDPDDRRSG